jgi:hypothetical protein
MLGTQVTTLIAENFLDVRDYCCRKIVTPNFNE